MSFEEQIKKWVLVDNQLRILNDRIKKLREEKNTCEVAIMEQVELNKLDNTIINISDGNLRFVKNKQNQPLTFKYMEECLHKCIRNPDQVAMLIKYIKENRESSYSSDIRRIYTNK